MKQGFTTLTVGLIPGRSSTALNPTFGFIWLIAENSAFMLWSMKCPAKINLNPGMKYRYVAEKSWILVR